MSENDRETPARYSFYVDGRDVPADKVEAFLKKAKKQLKDKKFNNPMSGDDDTFKSSE